jgi:predicted lipase
MTIPYDTQRCSLYDPANLDPLDQQEKIIKYFFSSTIINGINALTPNGKQDAALCAELSRLVYLKFEQGGAKLTQLKDALHSVNLTLIDQFVSCETGTQGFIADSSDKVIIVFRGTEGSDIKDIITDVLCRKKAFPDLGIAGKVHLGFANAFSTVKKTLETTLSKSNLDKPILICGHSLGAALATLAGAALLPVYKKRIRLYTFGSPRVGDDSFASSISQLYHERYVDCHDIVTRLPLEIYGYRHVGKLNFIDANV